MPAIPPLDYSLLHERLSNPTTRKRYTADWETFVRWAELENWETGFGKTPESQELLLSFLRSKRAQDPPMKGTSLRTFLSHLSTLISYFYDFEVTEVSFMVLKRVLFE